VKSRLSLAVAVTVALVAASSAAAFTPSNQYYAKQWYLAQDHAFDAWLAPPPLKPVKIAIVDSGVDCSLPDLQGQVVAEKSFVGGSACTDTAGHGTIVAGEIAADLGGTGIVGLAYGAQLVVAKVVAPDGSIPLSAEAAGIRWAVNQGAKVINLSLGGVRDPADVSRDTYSAQEARAVAYAYGKGAVVVAAAGNSDEAGTTPWPYASWPAALPHVIGVAALNRAGNVPDFSDRDPMYVDLAAPGVDIFSTFPVALTAQQQGCALQGYTDCAPGEYQHPQGTSFAAPQVSAAATVLLGLDPLLTNSQVGTILERTADDVNGASGCPACPTGRDLYSGWGRLDVAAAVTAVTSGPLPAPDRYEPNDNVSQAWTVWGRSKTVAATLDYWDDPLDVYAIRLGANQRLIVQAHAKWAGAKIGVVVLKPGATSVKGTDHGARATQSRTSRAVQRLAYRASTGGWYYIEVSATAPGGGAYTLQLTKTALTP
jgi:hypothetical protein